MSANEEFGAAVRDARTDSRVTQRALARIMTGLGFPWAQATVAQVESGHRKLRLDEAVALRDAINVDLYALTGSPSKSAYAEGRAAGISDARLALDRLT